MALSDYLNGPHHKARSAQLEEELSTLRKQHDELQQLAKARSTQLEAELSTLRKQHDELQQLAKRCGAFDIVEIQRQLAEEGQKLEAARQATLQAEIDADAAVARWNELRSQVLVVEETLLLESFALYLPKFKLTNTAEYKERLSVTREQQQAMVKAGTAATGNMNWEVNGKKSEGMKLVKDMIKLVLRSFNNECDTCVDNVKFDNVELGERRIRQSFDACNKLGRVMTVELSQHYLQLKLDELHLAHEFQIKRQEEKEEAKRIREELREQQKLEQEIRAAREKIAKERRHFATALRDLEARLQKAGSTEERSALTARVAEVEAGRAELDGEEKEIDYREQNAKAGYVYVISNLGAFGEGVYKIGMTRRLDPMERVDELGDASVPFWFDVHAMVFSENAPALEAKLHDRFAAGRINRVNERKEFFRASIEEIESVIRECFDPVAEVVREAPAAQYRESLRMATPLSPVGLLERTATSSAAAAATR